jgi:hypothetical protein
MTDVAVYYFMRSSVPAGEEALSKRRATLETIQGKGEAVMQSLHIVDHTELDANGFVIGGASNESQSPDELWPRIRSFELRAKSRDEEALTIAEGTESDRKQALQSESLELKNQAQILRILVDGIKSENLRARGAARKPISYWAPRARLRRKRVHQDPV